MSTNWKISLVSVVAIFGLGFAFSSNVMANMPRPGGDEFMPLNAIHDKLHLSEAQEKTWQTLTQKTQTWREVGRKEHGALKSQLKQELDKSQPDFAALAAKADRIADERTGEKRRVREEWLKFYASLSPTQQTTVRDELRAKLAGAEKRLEHMKQRRETSGQR